MHEYKYLISIIIPTRNRQIYAAAAVRHILSISTDIQIIVQDNSDDKSLYDLLKDLLCSNQIVYNYVEERIAGVENYNLAASYVEGEYFCAIGDDDTVLPNIIDCAQWMKRNGIDAVQPLKRILYWWPNPENIKNSKRRNGYVWIGAFSGSCVVQDQYGGMKELLRSGGQGYMRLPIIGSYHGLVRFECMRKVYNITGRYYGGLSPDMYSAACLSLLPDIKFVKIDYPITLPGACPQSTSAQSVNKRHVGKLETAPHFIGLKQSYIWDRRVPKYYSVETIWAETLLQAISAMGYDQLIKEYFNEKELLRALYINNYEKREEIMSCVDADTQRFLQGLGEQKYNRKLKKIYKYKEKIQTILGCWFNKELIKKNCYSIETAVEYVYKFLNSKRNLEKWEKICNLKI